MLTMILTMILMALLMGVGGVVTSFNEDARLSALLLLSVPGLVPIIDKLQQDLAALRYNATSDRPHERHSV